MKSRKHKKRLYLRFGNIPEDEISRIYWNGEEEIGQEVGVSVYDAIESADGTYSIGLPLPVTRTSLHTQQHLIEYDNRPLYLVTGDFVGRGRDNEPLIRNVRIIKELKDWRKKTPDD